ncbi:hypothetical protein AX17_000723 [Amanita inopinata Kibby_2008]|nr:hypothetical protein AX17_000723 [Amanita inopinata Kibby_2008]
MSAVIESSQDFVRALKSTTDPLVPGGPTKIEIAERAWRDSSLYLPNKAEVIADWILTKLLKDRGKDGDANPVVDVRYWSLLVDIIRDHDCVPAMSTSRPLKTWLSAILARVPIAPIVLSFFSLSELLQNSDFPHEEVLSRAFASCLTTLWPIGVQKTTTETLQECFGLVLALVPQCFLNEELLKVADLVTRSYRNSLANNSNKKKVGGQAIRYAFTPLTYQEEQLYNLFLQNHLRRWLECNACTPDGMAAKQLLDSIYDAGIETVFNLDTLRQSQGPKPEYPLLSSLQNAAGSTEIILTSLPRLFHSFLQAIRKHRTSLFGHASNQHPSSVSDELDAAGMRFLTPFQAILRDAETPIQAWITWNALLNIVKDNHLFNRALPDAEIMLSQIVDLAIESLASKSFTFEFSLKLASSWGCLTWILDQQLLELIMILFYLLSLVFFQNYFDYADAPAPLVSFLNLLLDYHAKTRTVHKHISNLLDVVLSPKRVTSTSVASCDAREIYESEFGSALLHFTYLDHLAKIVQSFVTSSQTLLLAKTIADNLQNTWEDLESAAHQIRRLQKTDEVQEAGNIDVDPDVLAVRFSLLATLASVVLSSLPVRSLPGEDWGSLGALIHPIRSDLVRKVIGKLNKKLRSHSCQEAWSWQICAAAVLRMGYALDSSRNLVLVLPSADNDNKVLKRLAELAGNRDILPELGLELFRYLFSKSTLQEPTETQAVIDQALLCLERGLSPVESKWSGHLYRLTYSEGGRADGALALLHMLVERWLPVIDKYATGLQLKRLIETLMGVGLGDAASSQIGTELRPQHLLALVLRSAHFWELPNVRPTFLAYLSDSTSALDKPSEREDPLQLARAITTYKLILCVPLEYLSRPSRTELSKRALNADTLLCSDAGRASTDVSQSLTVLRIFLKRVFVYTGHAESSVHGLAGSVKRLMNTLVLSNDDGKEMYAEVTPDLICLYLRELLKLAEKGDIAIVPVLKSMENWTSSDASISCRQGVIRMIELVTSEFSLASFPEEIKTVMRTVYEHLTASVLSRMTTLVGQKLTAEHLSSRSDVMALWSCLLSFGRWLGVAAQEDRIRLFGRELASKIISMGDCQNKSAVLDDARVMVLMILFQELQHLPEEQHLDRIVAVYISFAPVLGINGRERLDAHMSRACRSLSASNYGYVSSVLSESLSSHEDYSTERLVQLVYLATRLLSDHPQNTLKYTQAFTTQCINTFAGHDRFINGPVELRIHVLDYVAQLCSKRPAVLRSSDLSGIWRLFGGYLAPSPIHDEDTSREVFHRIVTAVGALIRLRRDLITWTLPHLGMILRQLILCMKSCRPMLGAKQTTVVTDSQPRWINAKRPMGVDEAKVLSRLLETLGTKTVIWTHVLPLGGETQKAESLAKPFSKHAIYVVKAYIECMNDPLCVMGGDVRKELQPGLFALCGMVSEHSRDAVMVSALDVGGKTFMKNLWQEYEKQKYATCNARATMLKPTACRSNCRLRLNPLAKRRYATVFPSIIVQPPPPPPRVSVAPSLLKSTATQGSGRSIGASLFDTKCLAALSEQKEQTPLTTLIDQYVRLAGHIIEHTHLPYESRPTEDRRVSGRDSKDMVLVAHCATDGVDDRITLSSGFLLNAVPYPSWQDDECLVLTCAHTLEEIRQSSLLLRQGPSTSRNWLSGTFVITSNGHHLHPAFHAVSRVVSSLPRSGLVLLSCKIPPGSAKPLPVSPYPAPNQTRIRAHFVVHQKPEESGWSPWLGGTWSKWVSGEVLGYRDLAGRETRPGTYDALSHMLFTPQPTAGSSGGPIVDEESGGVVGVMVGTRMDRRVDGLRGWGVPAEAIFEMFALPGLCVTSNDVI